MSTTQLFPYVQCINMSFENMPAKIASSMSKELHTTPWTVTCLLVGNFVGAPIHVTVFRLACSLADHLKVHSQGLF